MERNQVTKLTVCMGLWLAATPVWAIITRHDIPDADYIVDDADYPALVDMFRPGDCIATLISDIHLLTVAHCAGDLRSTDTFDVNGVEYALADVHMHPSYGWVNDIAIMELAEPVVGVEPYGLYRETDELGQMLTLVGRGLHATGLVGEPGASVDGNLRRATNVVDEVSDQWLVVTFEDPSDPSITDLEGVGAGGDSGSPAFLEVDGEMLIAGLNSWGDAPGGVSIGEYGAFDVSTRVSMHLDWIDSIVPVKGTTGTGTATGTTGTGTTTGTTGTGTTTGTTDIGPTDTGTTTGTGTTGTGTTGTGTTGTGTTTGTTGGDTGDTGAVKEPTDEGCGCSQAPSSGGALAIAMATLLSAARRRR